jgi:hypothetical protein
MWYQSPDKTLPDEKQLAAATFVNIDQAAFVTVHNNTHYAWFLVPIPVAYGNTSPGGMQWLKVEITPGNPRSTPL